MRLVLYFHQLGEGNTFENLFRSKWGEPNHQAGYPDFGYLEYIDCTLEMIIEAQGMFAKHSFIRQLTVERMK